MSRDHNLLCLHCGEPVSWVRAMGDYWCGSCRTSEFAEDRPEGPETGDTILSSGSEHTICSTGPGLASVKVDGLTIDFFQQELKWDLARQVWVQK